MTYRPFRFPMTNSIPSRSSLYGIGPQKFFLVVDSILQALTCGLWVPSSLRCAPGNRCSLVTLKSMKSSRSSSMLPDLLNPWSTSFPSPAPTLDLKSTNKYSESSEHLMSPPGQALPRSPTSRRPSPNGDVSPPAESYRISSQPVLSSWMRCLNMTRHIDFPPKQLALTPISPLARPHIRSGRMGLPESTATIESR